MSTARFGLTGSGTGTLAVVMGGGDPIKNSTEEWLGTGSPLTQTIDTD